MIYLGDQQVGLNNSQNNEFVSYIENQELTTVQKERARDNIGAASAEDVENKVDDVQINGTSILQDGVANVPVANANDFGLVKVSADTGISINSTNGLLGFIRPTSAQTKAGTAMNKILAPSIQHESTFYGLAKAAGDTTQSVSDNAVGVYTDEAKKAIRQMLGIPNFEWELIADKTVLADTDRFEVTTDTLGQPFELRKMLIRVYYPNAADRGYTTRFMSTSVYLTAQNGANTSSYCPTLSYNSNYSATVMEFVTELFGGIHYSYGRAGNGVGTTGSLSAIASEINDYTYYYGIRLSQYVNSATSVSPLILEGTRVKIYGIRI